MIGDWFYANDALKLGLVNRVVPPESLLDTAIELAEQVRLTHDLSINRQIIRPHKTSPSPNRFYFLEI